MKLTLIVKKKQAQNVISFIFKPEKPIAWKAGQYLIYSLKHESDLRGKMRFMTISSAPFEKNIVVTTRIEKKPSSFKNALNNLKIGQTLETKGPDGDLYIKNPKKTHVFVAGGIGITPFWSILKDLNHKNLPFNIMLLYANKNSNFLFKKAIENFQKKHSEFKIYYLISPQKITKETFLKLDLDFKKTLFFVSGPEKMIDNIEGLVESLGAKSENIRKDYFTGYSSI